MYLLDTCTLSDYIKGEVNTITRLRQEKPIDICIPVVTVFEIDYGLALKPSLISKIKPQLKAIYDLVEIMDFSLAEAEQAAQIRQELKSAGTPIGAYDLLIAATARANQLILVTSNIKEFSRVKNLNLENWREDED